MGNFTEIDEIKRLKDEAEQLREEIRCLIAYKVSKNTSMGNTDEEINKRRKKLVNILTTLELVTEMNNNNNKIGDDNNDRYKNHKRKQRIS